jgi:hypothetical protein
MKCERANADDCRWCRFSCKSLFALAIKNSFGRRRDFRVKMWGTSLSEDKLAGDLAYVIEATSIGGRRSDFFTAGKLAPGNFGLLQQYLPIPDSCSAAKQRLYSMTSSASESRLSEILMLSALAVFRLITSSNLVGCRTGTRASFGKVFVQANYHRTRPRSRSTQVSDGHDMDHMPMTWRR